MEADYEVKIIFSDEPHSHNDDLINRHNYCNLGDESQRMVIEKKMHCLVSIMVWRNHRNIFFFFLIQGNWFINSKCKRPRIITQFRLTQFEEVAHEKNVVSVERCDSLYLSRNIHCFTRAFSWSCHFPVWWTELAASGSRQQAHDLTVRPKLKAVSTRYFDF